MGCCRTYNDIICIGKEVLERWWGGYLFNFVIRIGLQEIKKRLNQHYPSLDKFAVLITCSHPKPPDDPFSEHIEWPLWTASRSR